MRGLVGRSLSPTHLATTIPETGDLEAEEHVPNEGRERMISHTGSRGAANAGILLPTQK